MNPVVFMAGARQFRAYIRVEECLVRRDELQGHHMLSGTYHAWNASNGLQEDGPVEHLVLSEFPKLVAADNVECNPDQEQIVSGIQNFSTNTSSSILIIMLAAFHMVVHVKGARSGEEVRWMTVMHNSFSSDKPDHTTCLRNLTELYASFSVRHVGAMCVCCTFLTSSWVQIA